MLTKKNSVVEEHILQTLFTNTSKMCSLTFQILPLTLHFMFSVNRLNSRVMINFNLRFCCFLTKQWSQSVQGLLSIGPTLSNFKIVYAIVSNKIICLWFVEMVQHIGWYETWLPSSHSIGGHISQQAASLSTSMNPHRI